MNAAPQPETPTSWWPRLGPDLKAALQVGVIISVFQVLSDTIPLVGFALTTPFSISLYYLQGAITGKFTRLDPRHPSAAPGDYAHLGARSGLWTSVGFSTVLSLATLLVMTPLTAGSYLLALPAILVSSLIDVVLNVSFSTLGAWLYGRFGEKGAVRGGLVLGGCSCLLVCLLSILALAVLGAAGVNLIHSLSKWRG